MPIPQVERKKTTSGTQGHRSASSIRKLRAQKRQHGGGSEHRAVGTGRARARSTIKRIKDALSRDRIKKTLWTVLFLGGGLFLVVMLGMYIWVSKDLADITDVESRLVDQSTKIYAKDGETLLYEVGDNKRTDVKLDQVTDMVEKATIALEDKNFYEHPGFQLSSFIRAALKGALPGEQARGTSTLTQQFIKNAVLSPERTYTRKVKEIILAVRLEQKFSKDEILNMYLNEVYYGANYQGIEAAATGYLGKHASELTLDEAATLAALPQNPVLLPRDPERLKGRRDFALDQMVNEGYITSEEAEEAKQKEITISEAVTGIKAPHFVFYVREYLEEKYGQNNVRRGGMKVITTLDWDKQQKAEEAVSNGIEKIEQYGGSNAALVSLDTHTGQILAMVGSRDWFDTEHDGQVNVVTSPRQPGSSFKPIAYLTAFEKGFTPDTKVFDIETDFLTEAEGKYHPRNYDLGERGPITLRNALAQSLNIPAVKVLYLVGVSAVIDNAEKLGYTTFGDRSRFGLSVALGGAEVTLLEHTAAFATFSREGEYHKPSAILKVEDKEGKTLEEWEDQKRDTVDSSAVRTLNSVLSDSGARAGFTLLNLKDRPAGAKTGTTNDFRDAWTMGFTPSVATGVWTGNNDNTEMKRGADGSIIAAPIWNAYMNAVLAGTPVETFKSPSYSAKTEVLGGQLESTVTKTVDRVTGELIPDECVGTYPSEYTEQREFKEVHTILHYLTKENPTGPVPENPRQDPMYEPWETAVVKWAQADERKNDYLTDSTPRADCAQRDPDQQPTVTITSPESGASVERKDLVISAKVKPGTKHSIVLVEYMVDVTTVERIEDISLTSNTSLLSSYNPATLTAGKHNITVRATDEKGNVAEATTTITIIDTKKKKD